MTFIPKHLQALTQTDPARQAWVAGLPATIRQLQAQWQVTPGRPFEAEASCSWVAPCTLPDGAQAVLKIGLPHMEARDEMQGLRYWDGEPTVRLLRAEPDLNAMLLERCLPGTPLRSRPEEEQDVLIAGLLHRLWAPRSAPHRLRPLAEMIRYWNQETQAWLDRMPDPELARVGMQLRTELAEKPARGVTLATDLHAGNVLQAERQPWLVIDPKPFFGDAAYDATQHLLNCRGRLEQDPIGLIQRFADLLEVDWRRVQLWLFARMAVESSGDLQRQALAIAPV